MAVKIRLKRMGKIRAPFYRVVVMDSRTKRDGRAIEEIGKYHPTEEPSLIDIDSERAQYWLGVGAQPTEQVLALLKVTGDWQKFKGEAGAEGTLKVAEPRPDKKALYEAALAASDAEEAAAPDVRKPRAKKAAAEETPAAEQAPAGSTESTEEGTDEQAPAVEATESTEEAAAEQTAPAADTEGSEASATGDTAPAAPSTDEPATASTDEA